LYQVLQPAGTEHPAFQYVQDSSPFGYATAPRSNYSWSRICGTGTLFVSPKPCPFSDTVSVVNYESNGTIDYEYPYGVNMSVPMTLIDTYSSGTSNTTVSNYFDIQYRRSVTTSSSLLNNGSSYLIGSFRNVQTMVLNNATQPIEGLVIDTVNGGVGLRNHTAPSGFQYGASWSEDILFIVPETICVNTNLTLDYTYVSANNSDISNVTLTDRGGFVNLNRTYPYYNLTDPQSNPDLAGRAYKAAWVNNALMAAYFNVTDPTDVTKGTKAFSYLNSAMNMTFPMTADPEVSFNDYNSLNFNTQFGVLPQSPTMNTTAALNTNPFGIGSSNFTVISIEPAILCEPILIVPRRFMLRSR
jgi:hypothetical protein